MKKLRKAFLSLTLIGIAFVAHAQQTFLPTNPTECTQSFFTALTEENAPSLRALLTIDFSMVSFDGGLIDAATLSDAIGSGSITIDRGDVQRMYSRIYGDAGVVTGTWDARGKLQGYDFQNRLSFMALCVRQGGSWKVAGIQFTPQP